MKLDITAEKVREAAKGCPDATKVLQTLFPQAFEREALPIIQGVYGLQVNGIGGLLCPRIYGKYAGRGLLLHDGFDWSIVRDDDGYTVLIAKERG